MCVYRRTCVCDAFTTYTNTRSFVQRKCIVNSIVLRAYYALARQPTIKNHSGKASRRCGLMAGRHTNVAHRCRRLVIFTESVFFLVIVVWFRCCYCCCRIPLFLICFCVSLFLLPLAVHHSKQFTIHTEGQTSTVC